MRITVKDRARAALFYLTSDRLLVTIGEDRLAIPKKQTQDTIYTLLYNAPAGHFGRIKTLAAIQQ